MPIHPKKSREAHSQIGHRSPAAVSSISQDSLSRCDLRGPHPIAGRDAAVGQPLPYVEPSDLARAMRDDRPDLYECLRGPEPPSSWKIALWCVVAVAVVLFVFALNDPATGILS
jgi:hypothetical protein